MHVPTRPRPCPPHPFLARSDPTRRPTNPCAGSRIQRDKPPTLGRSHTSYKGCRKLRVGAVPFSPAYNKIIHGIRYWKAVLKPLTKGKKPSRRLMRRDAQKSGIHYDPADWTETTARSELRQLYKRNKFMKQAQYRAAKQQREDFIERLAQAPSTGRRRTNGPRQVPPPAITT